MSKYKIGDKVKIREDLNCDLECLSGVDTEMLEYAGKNATIKSVRESYSDSNITIYKLDIDHREFMWNDDMFEDTEEEPKYTQEPLSVGDTVILRDDLQSLYDIDAEKYYLCDEMVEYAGKEAEITGTDVDGDFYLDVDDEEFVWVKELIKSKVNKEKEINKETEDDSNSRTITIDNLKARGLNNGDMICIDWGDECGEIWYISLNNILYRFNSDIWGFMPLISEFSEDAINGITKAIFVDNLEPTFKGDLSSFLIDRSHEKDILDIITTVTHPEPKQAIEIYEVVLEADGDTPVFDFIKNENSDGTPDYEDVVVAGQNQFGIVKSVRIEMLTKEEASKYDKCKLWRGFTLNR